MHRRSDALQCISAAVNHQECGPMKCGRVLSASAPLTCNHTHALQPEATNALLGGCESWLALPLPPENAPHSPHASTPHHLVACQTNKQATQHVGRGAIVGTARDRHCHHVLQGLKQGSALFHVLPANAAHTADTTVRQ